VYVPSDLDDLDDVTAPTPTSGDFLQWDGTAWVNQDDGLVPTGGLEGQILAKTTDTDHDISWIDNYTGDLRIICKNDSGVTINKADVVMAVGAVGDRIQIEKAVADGSVAARYMLGLAAANIPDGEEGYVQMLGEIRQVDTDDYLIGTVLYIDPAVHGGLTDVTPTSPDLAEAVAIVTRSHPTTGILFVRMWSQGESLGELYDVALGTPSDGDVLTYDSTTGVWAAAAPTGGGGGGGASVLSDFVDPYSYIGVAPSGSATSAAVWDITRIEMDTGFPVTTATGVEWDDRLTETYS
jgi:hypothetical protein